MLRPPARRALGAAVLAAVLATAAPAPAFARPGAEGERRAEGERWALDAVNAPQAWKVSKGEGAIVAILASGYPDDGVPELKGKVEKAPDMTGALSDSTPRTENDDTGLAFLAVGGGRDDGISGIAPRARLLSVPVAAQRPAGIVDPQAELGAIEDSAVARGIRYAANQGASVICLPMSEYGVRRADREAVSYALARGAVLVSPVGDDGQSPSTRQAGTSFWKFPAGYPGVVGVGAVDRDGAKTAGGSDNMSVLVAAPGARVPVTLAGGRPGTMSGTGAAAALVAGAAALIKAKYPDMPPELVVRALTSTARPHPRAGYDDKVGFGVIDAAAALTRAKELTGYARALPVEDGAHFGKGALPGAPARPGPDPVRLWIYGIAVVLGIGGSIIAAAALSRR